MVLVDFIHLESMQIKQTVKLPCSSSSKRTGGTADKEMGADIFGEFPGVDSSIGLHCLPHLPPLSLLQTCDRHRTPCERETPVCL